MSGSRRILPLLFGLALAFSGCGKPPAAPAGMPPELSIEEHPLNTAPVAETYRLPFTEGSAEDKRAAEREQTFDFSGRNCYVNQRPAFCADLDGTELDAQEYYAQSLLGVPVPGGGKVVLRQDGKAAYHIGIGDGSPIPALRGLWVYDGHWALETAYVTNHMQGNVQDSDARGQVTVDGVLLNKKYSYQEAFGFQTMRGKPFYFFKKDALIGISYDGVEIPLGYEEVPHYGCCSYGTLNPFPYLNMVSFFARKGAQWYYIEIGVFE